LSSGSRRSAAVVGRGTTAGAASPSRRWGRIVTIVPADVAAAAAASLASLPEAFFVERIHRIGLLNDRSVGTVQSGTQLGPTPIWNQGLRGEGQIVGEIDTGLDVDSIWFRDTARGLPVTNTWSAQGGYGTAVDRTARKVIAYDFLYSCAQYPGGFECETPSNPMLWDTLYHGTHVAGNMTADSDYHPLVHDTADGVAPAAKIVPQDAGYRVDNCGDLPGIGCPVIDTYPLYEQAFLQGVRIHK
jgi:subtilisin family serine protease